MAIITKWNITNTSAKYYYSSTWTDGAYGEKTSSVSVLLSTGASEEFAKQNIYDLVGNVWEWTLEKTSYTSHPCASRGGSYLIYGSDNPASYRGYNYTSVAANAIGFRVTLW